jgi:hypothetical protein
MRTTMMNALLCTCLAILSKSILAGAGDNNSVSVSVLQKPVLSLQLNSHAEMARTVSTATHLLEHDRRLQSIDFQMFCNTVEASGSFSCDCDAASLIAVCDSSEVCDSDTCATFHVVNTFDAAFSPLSVQMCAEYTKQVATDYRDGCATFTLNGQLVDTCELAFVDDIGDLTICNECRICDGRSDALKLDIDCSNIEVEASTSGCIFAEDNTEVFPGLASDSPPVGLMWAAAIATLLVGLHSF